MAKATTKIEEAGKVRTSLYISEDIMKKVKHITYMDETSQTNFISDALTEAIAKWEKKNGEAVKK